MVSSNPATLVRARSLISRGMAEARRAVPTEMVQDEDREKLNIIPREIYDKLSRTHKRVIEKRLRFVYTKFNELRIAKLDVLDQAKRYAVQDAKLRDKQRADAAEQRRAQVMESQASERSETPMMFEPPHRPVTLQENQYQLKMLEEQQLKLQNEIKQLKLNISQGKDDDEMSLEEHEQFEFELE